MYVDGDHLSPIRKAGMDPALFIWFDYSAAMYFLISGTL